MPHYFHRWKRKLGVLTLGMACVLAVQWFRSCHYVEIVDIKTPISSFLEVSDF